MRRWFTVPVKGFRRGRIYWIILDRPEKLNALDSGMWSSLADEVGKGCSLENVSLVVLRGSGRAFCTGDDIGAMNSLKGFEDSKSFFSSVEKAVNALVGCRKPVAALVHGYAYGGCAEILLLMDIVVAVRGTRISVPETRLGLIPPLITALGPIVIGRRARLLALTGIEIDADQALSWGLVDFVVDGVDEAEALLHRISERIAELEPNAVAEARRLAMNVLARIAGLGEGLALLQSMVLSEAARRRMRLFLEKDS